MTAQLYTSDYFVRLHPSAEDAAHIMVPFLMNLFHPQSVLDVGCGDGTWLKKFMDCGVPRILGIDAASLSRDLYQIDPERVIVHDLNEPLVVDEHFDLVLCLEVAEHLRPEATESLADFLVSSSPVIVFSAAIPGQGGTGHSNERWQAEWIDIFRQRGYIPFDILRPLFWNETRIAWWYLQNTLIYISEKELAQRPPDWRERLQNLERPLYSVVHPRCFDERRVLVDQLQAAASQDWTVSRVIKRFPIIVWKSLKHHLHF